MKLDRRRTYEKKDISCMVVDDLREMNISPRIVDLVIDSYLACKKKAISEGGYVFEEGLGTEGLLTRGVSERFSEDRFTVKIKNSISYDFQKELMEKFKTDVDFREVMNFTLPDACKGE